MNRFSYRVKVAAFLATTILAMTAMFVGFVACGTAQQPFVIKGLGGTDNVPPTLTILSPVADVTVSRGQRFLVEWSDTDRDDSALISFALVDATTNEVIWLVQNIQENDDLGPDKFSVSTDLIPEADYFLRGTIADGVNAPVETFAQTVEANPQNVQITIAPQGQGPPSQPPQVVVVEPAFNQSVAETDELVGEVQPTPIRPVPGAPDNPPYDADSNAPLYILLDTDDQPDNDDPANPDDSIIVLRERTVQRGDFDVIPFNVVVDLDEIPPRLDGKPYFIRATINDGVNPPVHAYASGTISVVSLASGIVDLAEIGRTLSGARFYGFNPQAAMGSSMSTVADFDADGVDDFVLVAQYGNPRGFGPVGEAYLIYGQAGRRFGAAIAANSVSEAVSGTIFEGPPVRTGSMDEDRGIDSSVEPNPRTDGITDVSYIRDLTADGRPEILFGLSHTHAAFDSMDYDPEDGDAGAGETTAIVIRVRQGLAEQSVDGGEFTPLDPEFYSGTSDLVISSCSEGDCPNGRANVPNGNGNLFFNINGPGDTQWILIKFENLLDLIPTTTGLIDIPGLSAQLTLRVFDPGGVAEVYESITDFDEQTTFSGPYGYAVNGGVPEPDVDYVATGVGGESSASFGSISGEEPSIVRIVVSPLVQAMLEGTVLHGELRLILIPVSEFSDPTGIRSSEFAVDPFQRPTLTIIYEEQAIGQSVGCYPDPYVYNRTDTPDVRGDLQWYGGGMAIAVNSTNRDNDPGFTPQVDRDRLENTVVSLEMVGQDGRWYLDFDRWSTISGKIFARADNARTENTGNDPQISNRIAGWRIVAGSFDYVDHLHFRQPTRNGLFGRHVASIGDMNQDGLDEIVISSPRNELYLKETLDQFRNDSTHWQSTIYRGSITLVQGENYNGMLFRDKGDDRDSACIIPTLDQQRHPHPNFGGCAPPVDRQFEFPLDTFDIFAEHPTDFLGDGQSAGDVNLDGVPDILCGAPLNDRPGLTNSGAVYIIEGRNVFGDVQLERADDPVLRHPMVRIRGVNDNDRIGHSQSTGLDINGDRLDDIFFASPFVDFEPVTRSQCAADFNGDDVIDQADLDLAEYNNCVHNFAHEVFVNDKCKAFDYNNDSRIDATDEEVFDCLLSGGEDCCGSIVDNGYVGVMFGGITLDGDFDITDVATSSLPGVVFYGGQALDRAGMDVSSAGDFNEDGFGDILITAPGRIVTDDHGRQRKGVVYLVFGGTHLQNRRFSLDMVRTPELPGIVFWSPYVAGRPNEAAPDTVALIGDINDDGFDDIAIGNTKADFINLNFPQGPNAPVDEAGAGRRQDTGDVYVIYGNNFGTNRGG